MGKLRSGTHGKCLAVGYDIEHGCSDSISTNESFSSPTANRHGLTDNEEVKIKSVLKVLPFEGTFVFSHTC